MGEGGIQSFTQPAGTRDRLYAGDTLLKLKNEELTSANGKYRLRLRGPGKDSGPKLLVLYEKYVYSQQDYNVQWHGAVDRAVMRADGNFVMTTAEGEVKWPTETANIASKSSFLVLQPDGNLVVYTDGQAVWSSRSVQEAITGWRPFMKDDYMLAVDKSDRLRAGQCLPRGLRLQSANGQFTAQLDDNGSLTISCIGKYNSSDQFWTTAPIAKGVSLCLDTNGDLFMYDQGGAATWKPKSGSMGKDAELVLSNLGDLRIHKGGRSTWSTLGTFPVTSGRNDALRWGQWLSTEQSLTSPNGNYTLIFLGDSNICIKNKQGDVVYLSDRKSVTGARLMYFSRELHDLMILDNKGYTLPDQVLWRAGNKVVYDGESDSALFLRDDGNAQLVMNGAVVWSAKASEKEEKANSTYSAKRDRNVLGPGLTLPNGASITSPDGKCTLRIQSDGNIVLYLGDVFVVWSPGVSAQQGSARIFLDKTGELYLMGLPRDTTNTKEVEIWRSRSGKAGVADATLHVEDDGEMAIYGGGSQLWRIAQRRANPFGSGP